MHFLLMAFLLTSPAFADINIKIVPKKSYQEYPTPKLRERVWQLEKAVVELQNKITELENNNLGSLTCYIKSFNKTFMATRNSKMAAETQVIKECSEATSSVHCAAKDVKCEEKKAKE